MTDLELLARQIRRTAIQDAVIGVVVLGLAGLVLAAFATKLSSGITGQTIFIGLMGLVFLWVAWLMFSSAKRFWKAEATRPYRSLSTDGKDVAWAHLTTGSVNALKLYFVDGDLVTINASRKDGERLMAFVVSRVPQVIAGYGVEQQRAWTARVAQHRGSSPSA